MINQYTVQYKILQGTEADPELHFGRENFCSDEKKLTKGTLNMKLVPENVRF